MNATPILIAAGAVAGARIAGLDKNLVRTVDVAAGLTLAILLATKASDSPKVGLIGARRQIAAAHAPLPAFNPHG